MIIFKTNQWKYAQRADVYKSHLAKRNPSISSNGFTIIEILIALTILSIGLLGMAKMQLSSINGNSSARVVTDNIIQASDQIEKLLLLPYDDADLVAGTHTGVAQPGYTLSWIVQDDNPVTGNKIITITVTPLGSNSDKVFTIEQIKSEIN